MCIRDRPTVAFLARNTAKEQFTEIRAFLPEAVRAILTEGLNREALLASLERFAFSCREIHEMCIRDSLINSRVVKAFVRGDYESQRFDKTTEDLRQAQLSSARMFTLTGPIPMGTMWTCTVLLLLFGGR